MNPQNQNNPVSPPKNNFKEKFDSFKNQTISYFDGTTRWGIYSALGYFPLVGWIIPLSISENELCTFHAKQSLKLNVSFLIVYISVWFLNEAPIISSILKLIAFENVTNFVLYICIWGYIIASIYSIIKSLKNEKWEIPFIAKLNLPFFNPNK
jgi:uncharacterized membrane protein